METGYARSHEPQEPGAAVYLSGVVILRLMVRMDTDAPDTTQAAFLRLFGYWQFVAAILVQGAVAIIVAAWSVRHHGRNTFVYGLLAAFLTGCLATTVFVGGIPGRWLRRRPGGTTGVLHRRVPALRPRYVAAHFDRWCAGCRPRCHECRAAVAHKAQEPASTPKGSILLLSRRLAYGAALCLGCRQLGAR
ncbi:hypothetical protein GCM10018779_11000 [Streptomyces griseocarneus]|nr:hypothetical protein GCM10018779_11000 [Streptomyces griseocarneus]